MIQLGRKLTLKNPLMLASGTFGWGDKFPEIYGQAGAFVSKTITPLPRAGNPPPRIVETASGTVNYVGLENPGLAGFLELTSRLKFPTVYIASFDARDVREVKLMLRALEATKRFDGYEMNLSCPNIRQRKALPFIDRAMTRKLVAAARALTKRWLCAKLPPYSCIEMGIVCEDAGADALCVSNTYPGIAFTPGGQRIQGGLAGPAVKPMTLYNIAQTAARVKIPIVASGGLCNARDVREALEVGAAAVQLGSINFVHPDAVGIVLRELGL